LGRARRVAAGCPPYYYVLAVWCPPDYDFDFNRVRCSPDYDFDFYFNFSQKSKKNVLGIDFFGEIWYLMGRRGFGNR